LNISYISIPCPPEASTFSPRSTDMINMRWILSFSVTALLLFSHLLPSSALESALNPLMSRVPGQHLQQERSQLAGSSFYNRKLGVHIKKRIPSVPRVGTRGAGGRKSSAIRSRISSFNVASVICVSLGFFML
jgi:hypothetical protein